MSELEELIQWWKDYLATQVPVFYSPLRGNIRDTITYLEKLNELWKEK